MRSALLIIFATVFLGFLSVSCKEHPLEWTPSMLDNPAHPFDAGRFVSMCSFNVDPNLTGLSISRNTLSSLEEMAYQYMNIMVIAPDTLYLNPEILNNRIHNGYNTFIVAQTIIPTIRKGDDDYSVGNPVKSIKGNKFSLDDFIKQAEKQKFPMVGISTYPKSPIIQMPSIFCSRTLTKSTLLKQLGVNEIPKYTEVMMAAGRETIAVRYTFSDNSHLTFLSSPFLLSNYCMSYENAQIAPRVMNLMRFAFASDPYPSNYLPFISFFQDGGIKNYSNNYTVDKDESKKKGRAFTTQNDDEQTDWSEYRTVLWIIALILAVLAPLFIPYRRRPIPVKDGYKNKSAEYAKHVGVMYSDEGNLNLILDNRISYFYYGVKNKYGIDLSDSQRLKDNASILASHWNRGADEVAFFLGRLDVIRSSTEKQEVTKESLAQLCEQMNLYSNL